MVIFITVLRTPGGTLRIFATPFKILKLTPAPAEDLFVTRERRRDRNGAGNNTNNDAAVVRR